MQDKGLLVLRCRRGHYFLSTHEECPACGAPLERHRTDPGATLIALTTVRVTPTGKPFRLGLARTDVGAKTLCIIDDNGDTEKNDRVVLVERDGLFYASRK